MKVEGSGGIPMRQLPLADYLALQAAFRRLVKTCGGLDAAAEITPRKKSQIANYYDRHHPASAPLDVIADLESEAGEAIVSRVLVQLVGNGFPEGYVSDTNPLRQMAESSTYFGAVNGALLTALEDGVISLPEARLLVRLMSELLVNIQKGHATFSQLLHNMEAEASGETKTVPFKGKIG